MGSKRDVSEVFDPSAYHIDVTVITPREDIGRIMDLKRVEMHVQSDFTKGYERWFVAERLHVMGRVFDTIWWYYCDNFTPESDVQAQFRQRRADWINKLAGTETIEKQQWLKWEK